jgi:hypothetical protein
MRPLTVLPTIWGGGQLFAFSGIEGETGWPACLVAVTLHDRVGLDFYSGRRPQLWLALAARRSLADGTPQAPFSAIKPVVVAGDVIVVDVEIERGIGCRLRIACADRRGFIGDVTQISRGLRAHLVMDLSAPPRDTDQGSAGEVVFATQGEPLDARWRGPNQQAFELVPPCARFAVALDSAEGEPASELLQAILSYDVGQLCETRLAFFKRVPLLRGADEARQRTLAKALSVLKVNVESPQGAIRLRYGVPDRAPHRWMWLWDTAFHAFGYAQLDMALARETVLAALSKVRSDGFLPHRLTPDPAGDSEITQPPILAWAARTLHQMQPDVEFLRRAYEPLRQYLRWDLRNRDRDHDGLLEWARPDESGMDNSPRFDGGFEFAAVDFNAFAAAEAECVADIAAALERPRDAETWRAERARIASAIEAHLWCEDDGMYYDRLPTGEFVRIKTCACFAPLFAGVAAPERAQRLIAHLTDPSQFWPVFPIPSAALDEPTYGDDMWRGPTWMNYNLLIIQGLRRYGYTDIAAQLAERCLDQVARWYSREGTIFEFYDPAGRVSPRRLHRKGAVPTHRSGGIPVITDYNWSAAVFAALAIDRYGRE